MSTTPRFTLRDSAEEFANLFGGMKELKGAGKHHPAIVACLRRFGPWVSNDETPWCGAFAGTILMLHGIATPGPELWRALQARRYLTVGEPERLSRADGDCLLILSRGRGKQPPASVLDAPGHVTFFNGMGKPGYVLGYGGNQSNAVNSRPYPKARVLGVRRMRPKR